MIDDVDDLVPIVPVFEKVVMLPEPFNVVRVPPIVYFARVLPESVSMYPVPYTFPIYDDELFRFTVDIYPPLAVIVVMIPLREIVLTVVYEFTVSVDKYVLDPLSPVVNVSEPSVLDFGTVTAVTYCAVPVSVPLLSPGSVSAAVHPAVVHFPRLETLVAFGVNVIPDFVSVVDSVSPVNDSYVAVPATDCVVKAAVGNVILLIAVPLASFNEIVLLDIPKLFPYLLSRATPS